MKILSIVFILFLSSVGMLAGPVVWIGGNGQWDNPQNWDSGKVPDYQDHVIIPSGINNVTIPKGYWAKVNNVEVDTGSNLEVLGGLILITTEPTALWCKGKVKLGSEAYMEILGDQNTTTGIWIDEGYLGINKEAEVWLEELDTGISIDEGYFSNAGEIHFQEIYGIAGGIKVNFQAYGYNRSTGKLFFKDMESPGINVPNSFATFYNSGLIQSTSNMDQETIRTASAARFFNQKDGQIIIKAAEDIAIENGGEFHNKGLIEILAEGMLQSWVGEFYNLSTGTIFIDHPTTSWQPGISLGNFSISSTLVNDGDIIIENFGFLNAGIQIQEGSELINNATGTVQINNPSASKGIFILNGSFHNHGGLVRVETSGSDSAIDVFTYGSMLNDACGEVRVVAGDLDINGTFQNDAWMYFEDGFTDIDISGSFVNNGLIADPLSLMVGLPGFDNQGVVFDRMGPAPVYPGPFIQDVLSIGDFDDIASITWHLSENGPSAGVFLMSSNQVSLFSNTIGAQSLWLNVDFDPGNNCGHTWVELPIQGGVQAPPPPPVQQADDAPQPTQWRAYPNPATESLDILAGVEQDQQVRIQLLNGLGQRVYEARESVGKGNVLTIIRPTNLVAGWYMLRIFGGNGLLYSEKVIWN